MNSYDFIKLSKCFIILHIIILLRGSKREIFVFSLRPTHYIDKTLSFTIIFFYDFSVILE